MLPRRIGIVGLGRFGTLLRDLLAADFDVAGYDVSGSGSLRDAASRPLVFVCVPISALEAALVEARPHLTAGATIIDVCSVKLHAVEVMDRVLPDDVHVLPSHPMFGPNGAANGINGLPFILCPTARTERDVQQALTTYLTGRGFDVVTMTPDEHDRTMAYSLCVTQFLGRTLDRLGIAPSASDTQMFRNLLEIRRNACNDTPQLFRDLQTLNPYAREMRQRLASAVQEIRRELGDGG